MRLWSVHPRYFDRQALTACWREGLLAQAVLAGATKGYRHHPQLERFREQPQPLAAVGCYLAAIAGEADARGYAFDRGRIREHGESVPSIPVTTGQLDFEWTHLLAKLATRSPTVAERWVQLGDPQPHPLFAVVPGQIAGWERPGARPNG
jgi:hypothetical protein